MRSKEMGDIVPRKEVSKQGMKGVAGVGAGVGMLVLRTIATSTWIGGLVVGGLIALGGLALTRSKDDRNAGLLGVAAGGLTMLASLPVLSSIATPLMLVGGIGLFLAGGWSLLKFVRGLRSRR